MLATDPIWAGRMVRAGRDLLGWTQARLACEAGVSAATVHRVEVGAVGVGTRSVAAIVAALERHDVWLEASDDRVGVALDLPRSI